MNGPKIVTLLFMFCLWPCFDSTALDVALNIQNREAAAKTAEAITSGVPFTMGVLSSQTSLRLLAPGNLEVPAQFLVTARWPDGSIRWVLTDFQIDLPANASTALTLQTESPSSVPEGITVSDDGSIVHVDTRAANFDFSKTELNLYGRYFEVNYGGGTYRAVPDLGAWTVEESGPMKTVLKVEGKWYEGASLLRDSLIRFKARLVFYRDKSTVRTYLTFQNNNSFGWQPDGGARQPNLTLTGASFGAALLPGGEYVFGSGIEKTWEVLVASGTEMQVVESRYLANGDLAPGFAAARPLALAAPSYYSSTGAWGKVSVPRQTADSSLQADFNLYEKIQRAKVIAADLENPPGKEGITVWGHMYQDISNWNHYGGLRWGGGYGPVSDNHYDWVYGMYLQMMRTGLLAFADAARVFAKHEIDFAIYHTNADGPAFNYQKNWESRPSNDSPDNVFGGGRPSHTWHQGYALHWLLSGDPRGKDAYQELAEGLRQYVYESFNGEGYLRTRELRVPGWIADGLVALWRINPDMTFATTSYGSKTIPQVLKDVLKSVFDFEASDGHAGYVYGGGEAEYYENLRYPLMNCYFIEPAIKAYDEVFQGRDEAYASDLLALITRMTDWLMSVTYGGDANESGDYRPRQIPYNVDVTKSEQNDGQIPYIFMTANAAGFLYSKTGDAKYLNYARRSFQDYVRYLGVTGGDSFIDPSLRTTTSYNSSVYTDTESKVHGWSSRYGQYYLAVEGADAPATDTTKPMVKITSPKKNARVNPGFTIKGTASDNIAVTKVQYKITGKSRWTSASGASRWSFKASKRLRRRKVDVSVRALDTSGNYSSVAKRSFRVR